MLSSASASRASRTRSPLCCTLASTTPSSITFPDVRVLADVCEAAAATPAACFCSSPSGGARAALSRALAPGLLLNTPKPLTKSATKNRSKTAPRGERGAAFAFGTGEVFERERCSRRSEGGESVRNGGGLRTRAVKNVMAGK